MIERVDGSFQQYIYNQASLVKAVHDFDGTVTRYHYKGRGQLQERLFPDNNGFFLILLIIRKSK